MRRVRFRLFRRLFHHRRPGLDDRQPSMTISGSGATRLGAAVLPLTAQHPGRSGVTVLRDGRNAFAARALLADAAERTLDIQYYIWRNDMSGTLLMEAVRRAAERGVRVRLLLDDSNTHGLDALLAALDTHPNIEVRLFNPFFRRRWRWLGYLTDFARLNRRMHNKSFTADGLVTIVGGRNVGDEYFDAGAELSFYDLDVLAIGPVVADVAADFDRYWACDAAYRADRVLPRANRASLRTVRLAAETVELAPAARSYVDALESSAFVRDLLDARLPFEWAATHLVSDDPARALRHRRHPRSERQPVSARLAAIAGDARTTLHVISPYLVPTRHGVAALRALIARGVAVSALTNSLEATDHAIVHAGYARRRRELLAAGVTLYEMKRIAPRPRGRRRHRRGSARTGLHAKTFATDHARMFVGSFNFDPRSALLNTEMGVVIDSPALARDVATAFALDIPERSYRLRLDAAGRIQWVEQLDGAEVVHTHEPGTTPWLRLGVALLALLPIEGLL